MATVKAFVRKYNNSKDGKQSVRLRIRHKTQSKEFALPSCRVHPDHWDSKEQVVTNDKMMTIRIQNEVMKYQTEINKQLVIGSQIDVEEVYNNVNGVEELAKNEEKPNGSLKAYNFINDYICNDLILSHGTRKNYKVVYNILKKSFPNLRIAEIDGEFLAKLEQKLKKKGLRQHTIHCRLKCLKAAANKAYDMKLIDQPDWRGFKLKKGNSTRGFLRGKELEKLWHYLKTLDKNSKEYNVLRAFLFSCYSCGARYGDLTVMTYKNFSLTEEGNVRLGYTMRKTGREISVVLNDKSKSLIDMQKAGSDELVFRQIKAKYLKSDKDNLSTKIESANAIANLTLKKISQKSGINRHLTFHMSRHSFCSNCLAVGIDHFTIKEIAGLSLRVLEDTYGKVIDENKTKAVMLLDAL